MPVLGCGYSEMSITMDLPVRIHFFALHTNSGLFRSIHEPI